MITLATNTADQEMYVTPFQRKKDFAGETFGSYLVKVESLQSDKEYFFLARSGNATLEQDNERYSLIKVGTNSDGGAVGSIHVTESGQYAYYIYGQNSITNLDVKSALVWGELERGLITFTSEAAWTMPTLSIPNNVVYYE